MEKFVVTCVAYLLATLTYVLHVVLGLPARILVSGVMFVVSVVKDVVDVFHPNRIRELVQIVRESDLVNS